MKMKTIFLNVSMIREIVVFMILAKYIVTYAHVINPYPSLLLLVSKKRLIVTHTINYINHFISDCNIRQVEFIADGECNEDLNTYPCNFDGGDCCILDEMSTNCHEEGKPSSVITTPNTSISHSISTYSYIIDILNCSSV